MPTPDRTTIKAALEALVTGLRDNLTADPPTAAKPLRRVVESAIGLAGQPRPALGVRLLRAEPIGTVDDDKLMAVTMLLEVSADAAGEASHEALLDVVGAIDDYLDSIRDTGVIEGADGLDERTWKLPAPKSVAGVRAATAEAEVTLVVRVQREYNREPA